MPIPRHRVRFRWGADREIDIEAVRGRGKPCDAFVDAPALAMVEEEAEPDDFAMRGIPAICWRDDISPLFEAFQLRENTDYFIDVTLPVSKAEAEAEFRQARTWPFGQRLITVFKADPPRRWKGTTTGGVIVSGQLRLKNHAGILDLSTKFETPLFAEVVCRKIDYLDEFHRLLDEVAAELSELLLQFESPISFAFNISAVRSETEAAFCFSCGTLWRREISPRPSTKFCRTSIRDWSTRPRLKQLPQPENHASTCLLMNSTSRRWKKGDRSRVCFGATPQKRSPWARLMNR